jgi:DNA processing protein
MGWEEKKDKKKQHVQKQLFVDLSPEEKSVTEFLEKEGSVSVDMISTSVNLSSSKVAAVLLNLEFLGIIRCLPGKIYELA